MHLLQSLWPPHVVKALHVMDFCLHMRYHIGLESDGHLCSVIREAYQISNQSDPGLMGLKSASPYFWVMPGPVSTGPLLIKCSCSTGDLASLKLLACPRAGRVAGTQSPMGAQCATWTQRVPWLSRATCRRQQGQAKIKVMSGTKEQLVGLDWRPSFLSRRSATWMQDSYTSSQGRMAAESTTGYKLLHNIITRNQTSQALCQQHKIQEYYNISRAS